MGYKKILVALDRSSHSDGIFAEALDLAKKEAAVGNSFPTPELLVFHCIPVEHSITPYSNLYGEELINLSQAVRDQLEKEKIEIEQWLREYCLKAEAEGIKAQWEWKIGEAGHLIAEIAQNWQADLVIVGRRGRRGLTEILLGSVSSYVVHHVPCCVLIVQGK